MVAADAKAESSDTLDPNAVQQSSWFAQVQEGIRKGEYNISWQDKSVIDGDPGGLHATNRANNMRAYFREDGVQIVERETTDPDWDLRWQFKGWGRNGTMQAVTKVAPSAQGGTVPRVRGRAGARPSQPRRIPPPWNHRMVRKHGGGS